VKYRIAETIHMSFYLLLLAGLLVLFKDDIKAVFWRIRMTRRLKTRARLREEGRITRHFDMLVRTTVSEKLKGYHLTLVTGIVFTSVTLIGVRSTSIMTALMFGILIGIMPYFFLRIKLENIRHKASFEGETFITSLISKYRISNFNMQRALELLIEDEKMSEMFRRLLMPAIMRARMTGDRQKIEEAFAEFNFAINTNWSRMASYNISAAFISGLDVTSALEDIMIQLREAKSLAEERKRLNAEAGRLVLFMVPVSYMASLILAVKYVGVTPRELVRNQFFTSQGFAFFVFILFMFLFNTALLKIIENKRFDY